MPSTLCGDGEEADELLRSETLHLVVLDLMLPGIGGKEVLHRLRRRRFAHAGTGADGAYQTSTTRSAPSTTARTTTS